jgi:hypothetical protein
MSEDKEIPKDDKSTWKVTKSLRKHIRKHWGRRCKTYERTCHVCRMWRVYDDFVCYGASGLDDDIGYLDRN